MFSGFPKAITACLSRKQFPYFDSGHTRVALSLSYEPEGAVEEIGDAIGLVSARLRRPEAVQGIYRDQIGGA
jgi:hypothetical protein